MENVGFNKFFAAFTMSILMLFSVPAAKANAQQQYSQNEILDVGHTFFGSFSQAFAKTTERIFSRFGQPNGYVLGEEASGAYIGGLRYGEGTLYTRNAGDHRLYWQGPSLGFDWGGDGNRTMMLVYNLNSIEDIYRRFAGVSGSAFLVGGVGMTVLKSGSVVLVPIRTGVGARLGINVGYLKIRQQPTWNPF